MNAIAKPFLAAFHLPLLALDRKESSPRHRKQTTIDLVHASPYLRRDIGLEGDAVVTRHK